MSMPKNFNVTILTPEKVFFKDEVTHIIVTTPEGDMGILAEHMPIIGIVFEGILKVEQNGVWRGAAVGQGFFDVSEAGVEFFVDSAEWAEDIDVSRSKMALERAEKRIHSNLSHTEYLRTHAAITRARVRLKVARSK
jgi:F-type H+-transporting ATPase subunit epsilon